MVARRTHLLFLTLWTALSAAPAAAIKPGDSAPAITVEKLLQAPEGSVATWEALRGKVVVLEFWATWCGPCIMQIPHMNELVEKFKGKPIQFISITDEEESLVQPFLKKRPMKPWIALDTDQSMMQPYEVWAIPYMVIVDGNGVIRSIIHPAELTEATLNDMLSAGSASSGKTR